MDAEHEESRLVPTVYPHLCLGPRPPPTPRDHPYTPGETSPARPSEAALCAGHRILVCAGHVGFLEEGAWLL